MKQGFQVLPRLEASKSERGVGNPHEVVHQPRLAQAIASASDPFFAQQLVGGKEKSSFPVIQVFAQPRRKWKVADSQIKIKSTKGAPDLRFQYLSRRTQVSPPRQALFQGEPVSFEFSAGIGAGDGFW